ncbi:hypothetical protein SCHPADRAFT_896116 [Schizopora paradoxa]|uniref:Uncharacterized protein n=1 Tax=Schizopora paradoxa TaxID=27342 RepID=A0A0H2R2P0_9AGAM|nr:hypothetical protein SCHPADRAFT_896116 [Schizopora paradoxa]
MSQSWAPGKVARRSGSGRQKMQTLNTNFRIGTSQSLALTSIHKTPNLRVTSEPSETRKEFVNNMQSYPGYGQQQWPGGQQSSWNDPPPPYQSIQTYGSLQPSVPQPLSVPVQQGIMGHYSPPQPSTSLSRSGLPKLDKNISKQLVKIAKLRCPISAKLKGICNLHRQIIYERRSPGLSDTTTSGYVRIDAVGYGRPGREPYQIEVFPELTSQLIPEANEIFKH